MTELEALQNYRRGKIDRSSASDAFATHGWDASDVNALLDSVNYAPLHIAAEDLAQHHINQQARRRKTQKNPLMPGALSRNT